MASHRKPSAQTYDPRTVKEHIVETPLNEEMSKSFLEYAYSVIYARALPDARDGLKPVQRRILFTMNELGITPDTPYRKCARIVGDCLGKYHPHGDSSVYDALVRLAQDFSMRGTLVDGHGNFGSVDGDGAKTLFNPDTKLYAPVTLVPHFSGTLETFQVTYVEGDQAGPEDNNSYQSGSYATVLGPKNGNLRFLYWKDEANNKIYKPGESMKMSGDVTLIAVYTEAPATVGLTYHNGTDSRTETGIRSNTFATVKSAANLGFTAPTGYVFVGWSTTENGAATYFPGNAVYAQKIFQFA